MDKLCIFDGRHLSNARHSSGPSIPYSSCFSATVSNAETENTSAQPSQQIANRQPCDQKCKLHIQPFVQPKTEKQVLHLLPCYKQHTNEWTSVAAKN